MNKVYVGNLAYSLTQEELTDHFQQYGQVVSATIILDRETNRSKGFGFVEFDNADGAQAAINSGNGSEVKGRAIKVALAAQRN